MENFWKKTVGLYNRTLIHSIFLIASSTDLFAEWFWHIGKHPTTFLQVGKQTIMMIPSRPAMVWKKNSVGVSPE